MQARGKARHASIGERWHRHESHGRNRAGGEPAAGTDLGTDDLNRERIADPLGHVGESSISIGGGSDAETHLDALGRLGRRGAVTYRRAGDVGMIAVKLDPLEIGR